MPTVTDPGRGHDLARIARIAARVDGRQRRTLSDLDLSRCSGSGISDARLGMALAPDAIEIFQINVGGCAA
jgi:hypothetical protein